MEITSRLLTLYQEVPQSYIQSQSHIRRVADLNEPQIVTITSLQSQLPQDSIISVFIFRSTKNRPHIFPRSHVQDTYQRNWIAIPQLKSPAYSIQTHKTQGIQAITTKIIKEVF
jgi:hypothetical protein